MTTKTHWQELGHLLCIYLMAAVAMLQGISAIRWQEDTLTAFSAALCAANAVLFSLTFLARRIRDAGAK